MKTITLVNSTWYRSFSRAARRKLLHDIFDLADEKGWSIRVAGQHWEGG